MTSITFEQLTGQSDSHIHWLSPHTGVHHTMLPAWEALKAAAAQAGFDLAIASGFRSFARQQAIWDKKFTAQLPVYNLMGDKVNVATLNDEQKILAIMLYSALPGASRHHWGCDIDIYAKNLLPKKQTLQLTPWEYQQQGYFYPLSQWLTKALKEFDFYFPYDEYRHGVAIEPWHISYAPLALEFEQTLTLEKFQQAIEQSTMQGKESLLTMSNCLYQQFVINTGAVPND